MTIVKIRFTNSVVAFDDKRMPVRHHFHDPDIGLTLEVRHFDSHVFVYGWREQSGVTKHAGQACGYWAHTPHDLYIHISSEMFRLAGELEVEAHHVWPFVEQLPLFTDDGVSVADAFELAGPIKDLLARGARPEEVMSSLNVDKATIEFAIGTKLPSPPPRAMRRVGDDEVSIW